MPKNGQFNELFNYAIRKTVESGKMDKFKTKWATEGKVSNIKVISILYHYFKPEPIQSRLW